MKTLLTITLCLILTSNVFSQQTISTSITHDGGQRDYILYVPASYDGSTAFPLLLCFHGYTSSNNVIMAYSGFNAIADTANFIAAYPQGTDLSGSSHWNVGGWTVGSTADDVGFVDALIDTIQSGYNINADRIYSTGMSNGGYMSFLLACQLSDQIAAIASITGSMTPETYNACNPTHPTPVLQIHGDNDGTVPYSGASWTKSINQVLAYWSGYNNNGQVDTTAIADINSADGSTVDQISYGYGDNCSSVIHYKVYGGGHDWPGAWGNMDIDASAVAWNFLSQFDINGIAGCVAGFGQQLKQENFSVFPNPATEFIRLDFSIEEDIEYLISDMSGRIVQRGILINGNPQIDISELAPNSYILTVADKKSSFIVVK